MNLNVNKYGSGFPLVFFHGWGFNRQIWLPLVSHFETDYQIIVVDLPGFGQSAMMGWNEFKQQLLTQLPAQFALVGWSMGGLYATRLAIEEPSRVSHLINITSSPYFILERDWPGVAPEVFSSFYQNLLKDPRGTLEEFIQLQLSKSTLEFSFEELPSAAGLELGLEILGSWDFREQLNDLKIPVCYMFGRLDPIVPVKTMYAMQKNYPECKYVFFNRAAHMPFLSHMDVFIGEIREFVGV